MSWETKQDYSGLAIENALTVKSANEGRTAQYLEKHGANGDYKATKVFGNRASPTNSYTVEAEATITGKKLGDITTVESKKYMLHAIKWSTGADAEPTFEGSAAQVEDGATLRNYFVVPDFKISPDHVAQIPEFKFPAASGQTAEFVPAFSLPAGTTQAPTNVGVELTQVSVEISASPKTNDRNGDPKAHDVTNGHIVIQLTIGQYGEQTPTITPAEGWDMSAPKTVDDQDSDMPTWTCTLSRPLEKVMHTANASS